jgi:hypothetical protein
LKTNTRRWSDDQTAFGPLTISRDKRWVFSAVLDSGDNQDSPGCHLRLRGFGLTLLLELPQIIKPWRRWVDTSGYHWSKPGGGYWDEQPREYGFSVSEGFLQVFLGAQTGDSETTQDWCKFLPWTQWRFVRFSLYDTQGNHFWTQYERDRTRGSFEPQHEAGQRCPSVSFQFDDYDGERIEVKTHIEEREWLFGKGWFKWLSIFRRPKVSRYLDLEFSKETGNRKGSWKGGTVGHAIEMLPGELPEGAFRRYCEQHEMTFLGPVWPVETVK